VRDLDGGCMKIYEPALVPIYCGALKAHGLVNGNRVICVVHKIGWQCITMDRKTHEKTEHIDEHVVVGPIVVPGASIAHTRWWRHHARQNRPARRAALLARKLWPDLTALGAGEGK
jgi:hypothetical protein